jgi:LAGLIDADG-like domain
MGLSRGEDRAAWYLAGLFDGEGCVSYTQGSQGFAQKVVELSNTDRSIIDTAVAALEELEIPYSLRGPIHLREERWTPYYSIRLSNYEAIARFAELVPFQCENKRKKIEHIVNGPRRVVMNDSMVDEVRRLYWGEGMTAMDVAERIGLSRNSYKNVLHLMHRHGIPTRTPLEAAQNRWCQ